MTGPLAGVLVADFTRVLAGPYATMLLGDLGATIVKVERPGTGDDTRMWRPPVGPDGTATYFSAINRNKHSVALDLESSTDRSKAQALAKRADVLIENFPSGSLERRGLGFADVSAANPGIIYCSIQGFGPSVELPGYDLVVQAVGGLMDITGDSEPTKVGFAVVDVLTGLHATIGILAALHERDQSGLGQRIDITLLASLLSSMVNQSAASAIAGITPTRMGNAHPSIAPYEPFMTADRPIVIAVGNDAQFTRFCAALDTPALAADPRFVTNELRVANRDELRTAIEEELRNQTADTWSQLLAQHRVPCGPINSISQALALASECGLTPIVDVDGQPQVANPLRLSRTPVQYRTRPPGLDEHGTWLEDLLNS